MDRNEVKVLALLEEINILHNKNADFRVQITLLNQSLSEANERVKELNEILAAQSSDADGTDASATPAD